MKFTNDSCADFSTISDEQKLIFLRVLAHLSGVDGSFDDVEKQYIENIASNNGISADIVDEAIAHDSEEQILEDVKKITQRRVALDLIKEMCFLAHTDDELSDEETLFIGKCGLAMGIELEKIEQISNWVIDRIVWLEQAKIIFEDL